MEDSFLFHTVLSLAVAIGINIVWKYGGRLVKPKPPRNTLEYMDLLERGAIEMLRSDLYAVQCKAAMFDLIGQIPADFDPTVFMMSNIGLSIQRAVMREAEEQGLARAGASMEMFGRPSEPEPAKVEARSEPQLRLVTPVASVSRRDLPSTKWVGGRIVPRIMEVS